MSVESKFCHYVTFDTQSDATSTAVPSTAKQLNLAKALKEECEQLGFDAVHLAESGIVYACLYATDDTLPAIGFCAHMDTATEISGASVHPRKVSQYDGSIISLNEEYALDPEEFPVLKTCIGNDLIVTDGTTLLGADDKAGIAIIMQAMEELIQSKRKHGKICVAFTPDEEVGRGVENFELDQFDVDFAYTLDGGRIDAVDYETFNASQATITIHGKSIHPGTAKGKMINAARIAAEFVSKLPSDEIPEKTEGREGFYHLLSIQGECEEATLTYILRNHDFSLFQKQKEVVQAICDQLNTEYGQGVVDIEIHDQYMNMVQYMNGDMTSVNLAKAALQACGINPVSIPVRGGTDGAQLTQRGLICPNLGTGSFNHHGRYEFANIQQMEKMVEVVLTIIGD